MESKVKVKKKLPNISMGISLEPAILDQVRLLARGWDRSVAWVIRELIDASLIHYYDELVEFRPLYADELGIDISTTPRDLAANTPSTPHKPSVFPPPPTTETASPSTDEVSQ